MTISDGIYERQIAHFYPPTAASEADAVFTLSKVEMSINIINSLLMLRLGSWRDQIMLSVDYNTKAYSKSQAEAYLSLVREAMSSLI
jgi:hypothetical protein